MKNKRVPTASITEVTDTKNAPCEKCDPEGLISNKFIKIGGSEVGVCLNCQTEALTLSKRKIVDSLSTA